MAKINQIVLLICVLVGSVICDIDMEKFLAHKQQTRKTCQEKTKVSNELIDELSKGVFPDGNKDLQCYVGCCMEQMGSIKNNKFDKETAVHAIDTVMPESLRAGAKKALNACAGKFDSISDSCELAYAMIKCWKAEDPTFRFA